tara:strand:- start:6591 stop:7889 length:1299 start_codon:yes stop_codon:yes gene_type:complete
MTMLSCFLSAQSFDIYDEQIRLKDMSYNFYQNKYSNSFASYAKSVKLENTTNELLDPIIKLKSSETLKLSFDIINSESITYAYTFIHCDSDWKHSSIIQSDYLNGFFDNYINEYQHSFNTLLPYVHYECIFPNEDITFKKSGNYIIVVYDAEKNIPIITKRFMIYEEVLNIKMTVKKATLARDMVNKQEVDFYIEDYKKLNIIDPHNELKIIIQKNDDWNDIINNCKPSFINNNTLEYDYQGEISFFGGNEYRDFDIKSLRYYGKNIQGIEKQNIQGINIYNVNLLKDQIEYSEEYEFKYDLNGKYVLSVSENREKEVEGDYVLVKFTLDIGGIENKDIYIYGELTNWDILTECKMIYNEKTKNYYGSLLLKQGYYNYQYILADQNKNNLSRIEGEYHETRNEYSIYTYYTPPWRDYDRLIGVAKSTSNALN